MVPITPDQTAAIAKIGHFVRDHQMALRDLEAKLYADSMAAETNVEKILAVCGVKTEYNFIMFILCYVF